MDKKFNILDYILWRGDLTFEQSPLNDIDALIFCQLTYLNFDGFFEDKNFNSYFTISELAEKFKSSPDFEIRSETGVLINKDTVKLLFDAGASKRFGNVKAIGYESIIDLEKEEQFAAMTFIYETDKNFIVYRGTDDNIVGWKEDFHLASKDELPSQKDAVLYIERAFKKLSGTFIVGGHSKGGNLAIYSCAKLDEKQKHRIAVIYNLDGPGFYKEKLESKEFSQIIPKIHSFYPQFSVVGMLFFHAWDYKVVESDRIGLMQHDIFSWHIIGKEFIELKSLDYASNFFHDTVNLWIEDIDIENRQLFIDTLFEIIEATDAKTNSEIEKNWLTNSVKIMKALSKLDSKTRSAIDKTVHKLFSAAHKKLPSFSEFIQIEGERIKNAVEKSSSSRISSKRK